MAVTACRSCYQKDAFGGNYVDSPGEESYMCYPITTTNLQACDDIELIIDAMSCGLWTEVAGYRNNGMRDAFELVQEYASPMLAYGDTWNRWDDDEDCRSWAATFEGVLAHQGKVEWWAGNVDSHSYFVLMGKPFNSSEWVEVGVKEGGGKSDKGVARHYVFGEPGDEVFMDPSLFELFVVQEFDDAWALTESEAFGWTTLAPDLPESDISMVERDLGPVGTVFRKVIPGTVAKDETGKYQGIWEEVGLAGAGSRGGDRS
jgi:hypothetical protein